LVAVFAIHVPEIGEIPQTLPWPQLPSLTNLSWIPILKETLAVFFLASVETLLSSSVVDRISKTRPHDSDQELIGQGLGNMAVSLMGGIPVTSVIARSAVNIRSGAKTRRSAIIHSLTLIVSVFFLAPWISKIPVAALAGVLIAISMTMLQPKTFLHLWKVSRGEAMVYATTFLVIVFVDLIAGIQAGFIAAAVFGLLRASQLKFVLHTQEGNYPVRISLSGSMTFLTTSQFDKIRKLAIQASTTQGLVLDFASVTQLDSSGSGFLIALIEELHRQGIKIALKSMRAECRKTLEDFDKGNITLTLHAMTESDVEKMLSLQTSDSPRSRLLHGVQVFQQEHKKRYSEIFERLAEGQTPHTLFITCSDSRIQPNLITATDPGELFVVRNVGNIIPASGRDTAAPAEGAAVEYAVGILGVREIVLCGHYGCGAMASLFSGIDEKKFPSVSLWLSDATNIRKNNPLIKTPDEATKQNVLIQLENLRTYPCVREAIQTRGLQLRGWIKDFKTAELYEWDEKALCFRPIREITS
jgi:carbonic anhydrase